MRTAGTSFFSIFAGLEVSNMIYAMKTTTISTEKIEANLLFISINFSNVKT